MLREALAGCGVDTELLYSVDGASGTAIVLLQPGGEWGGVPMRRGNRQCARSRVQHTRAPPGENSIVIVGGANTSEEWEITDEVTQAIQGAGAVLLQVCAAVGGGGGRRRRTRLLCCAGEGGASPTTPACSCSQREIPEVVNVIFAKASLREGVAGRMLERVPLRRGPRRRHPAAPPAGMLGLRSWRSRRGCPSSWTPVAWTSR